MKAFIKLFIPLILVSFLILATPGQAAAAQPFKLIVGGSFILANGETLNEDLTVVGGTVLLEEGSIVNGKIVVLGGSLEISGKVNGDVVAAGGYIKLNKSANVDGNISTAGGYVNRDQGATISGEVQNEMSGSFPLLLPGLSGLPAINVSFSPIWKSLWFLAQVLLFSALAVLAAMFFPKHVERVERSIATQPLISGSMGLLTGLITPFVVVLMVITICLIPAALVGLVLLGILTLFGWVAFGLEVGKRLGKLFKQEWASPISAGVGTFVLTLVIGGLGKIWCIGWVFPTVVALVGLGAAILTRFGGQDYPELVVKSLPPAEASPSIPLAETGEETTSSEDLGTPGENPTDH